MDRKAHVLADNKSTFRPRLHIFVDVESQVDDPRGGWQDHRFKLGWALYWRRRGPYRSDQLEWFKIDDPLEFWQWVARHVRAKTRVLLISHNLDYDLLVLRAFHHLPEMGWELKRFYLQPHCKILSWTKGSYRLQMVDNVNWFKGQLGQWAKVAGLPKLDVDPLRASLDDLTAYCRRDVEILHSLWQWWYQFIEDHDCGAWGVTLPSQAFHSFRHRFLKQRVWIHTDEGALQLERDSYHGGRTECFQAGQFDQSTYYKLDVNSMYPFCMWGFEVPLDLRGHSHKFSHKALRYRLQRYCVIARVQLNCSTPYFPHRTPEGMVYPVGRFQTVLTTPELRVAEEKGWIEILYEGAWYKKGLLFRPYVDYWYPLKTQYKEEGAGVQYEMTKLMLNSLYGKFGQQRSEVTEIGSCDVDDFGVTQIWHHIRQKWCSEYRIGGKVFWSEKGGESYHSFPAVAAHITAYARMYLYSLIEAVGRDHVYYCDTDSLILDSEGFAFFAPYLQPQMLGHLKVERVARYLAIHAPKDYQMDGNVVLKGIRKDAVWLDPQTARQDIFPSIKGLLKRGKGVTYATTQQIKRLERVIRSGVRTDSGEIQPWQLDQGEVIPF